MTSITDILRQSVVVFSQNYLPISRINVKRAIVLLITGKAEPLELADGGAAGWHVSSPSTVLWVPEHIRLKMARTERIWKIPPVNRREVLRRDNHTCVYCGSRKQLTLDHVLPKSKGGTHTWDNVVTACSPCNARKGDRTPQAVGMVLKTKPKAPMHPAVAFAEQFWRQQQFNI
ncbi:MAG: HNH endonuclease [Cyanobacteriota bacterium]|nr:HNH endonuclease [Cyanobacteriota bacterium]